jgi:hypothetical protein
MMSATNAASSSQIRDRSPETVVLGLQLPEPIYLIAVQAATLITPPINTLLPSRLLYGPHFRNLLAVHHQHIDLPKLRNGLFSVCLFLATTLVWYSLDMPAKMERGC